MLKSKTNSVSCYGYKFQPKRYDENNNLICALYRKCSNKLKCTVTGVYDFEKEQFNITWVREDWIDKKHIKLLKMFLAEYEWVLNF